MIVEGAALEMETPAEGFERRGFEHARSFQNRTAEWARDSDSEPVAVLRAPTGAGKTATFHELIEENSLTLVVYPTNALLAQQTRRFESEGVDTAPLNGDTLQGHGDDRVEDLLSFADRYSNHDIVVTNPDILQAVLQDMYAGATKPMRFFDRFDAVIYDEFHFYDDLAASGLLLQIRILHDRRPDADILLASATPNESFVTFVDDELSIPVRHVTVDYDSDGDQFRHPVTVIRTDADDIAEHRSEVGERLRELVDDAEDLDEPRVALVFNSVAASNDFHEYLAEEYPAVYEQTAKDNGFDTKDPETYDDPDRSFILNTTSKGEVGLDYDIRTLFMEVPRDPSAFLQRFGRAGRQHEATVNVFGLGEMAWPDRLNFPEFVDTIYEALGGPRTGAEEIAALRSLVGLRAAYALHVRMDSEEWFSEDLRADFAAVDEYETWAGFLRNVDNALERAGEFGSPITQNSPERKLLTFTAHCFDAFRGLRGRSLPVDVKYPRGDRFALTTYDLLTTLRHYDIEQVEDDGTIVVSRRDDDHPVMVTARFPGFENRPRDYSGSTRQLRRMFTDWLYPEIEVADLESSGVGEAHVRRFFDVVSLPDAVLPIEVRYDKYVAYADHEGVPDVTVERRQI